MPTYIYRCANHHTFERTCRVREHDSAVSCEYCDLVAQQLITPPLSVRVASDVRYASPVDGTVITSHDARREDMKKHGAVEYDPEMKKDAARWKREHQETFEAGVEETVCQEIAKMPSQKRAELFKEVVEQGATAEAVRVA